MGDRTSVTLTVRKKDYDRAIRKGFSFKNHGSDSVDSESEKDMVNIYYEDVNYAQIGIEEELVEMLIPYDKYWDSGHEYPQGEENFRIDANKNIIAKEFYGEEMSTVDLNEVIKAHQEGTMDEFIKEAKLRREVMTWEQQSEIMDVIHAEEDKALEEEVARIRSMKAEELISGMDGVSVEDILVSLGYNKADYLGDEKWYIGSSIVMVNRNDVAALIDENMASMSDIDLSTFIKKVIIPSINN